MREERYRVGDGVTYDGDSGLILQIDNKRFDGYPVLVEFPLCLEYFSIDGFNHSEPKSRVRLLVHTKAEPQKKWVMREIWVKEYRFGETDAAFGTLRKIRAECEE